MEPYFSEEMEYLVEEGNSNFSSILTAAYEEALPILQWDSEVQ